MIYSVVRQLWSADVLAPLTNNVPSFIKKTCAILFSSKTSVMALHSAGKGKLLAVIGDEVSVHVNG